MTKHATIITTIHPCSTGIERFLRLGGREVVVVADRKTPAYKETEGLEFLSVQRQQGLGFRLGAILPFDHYCRKNLGYLWAMTQGAETIYDTDDDNLPYDDWAFPEFVCELRCDGMGQFVNMYRYFTTESIWPRGFPLNRLQDEEPVLATTGEQLGVGVWQGLADGDPDVDAIFRLIYNRDTKFDRRVPAVLPRGRYCPFNSQNTLWSREAFGYLYLPVTVSFRFTDILRGYLAQRGLWEHGLHLGFTRATVWQERNAHDLMRDFRDEVECYLNVERIVEILERLTLGIEPLKNLRAMYEALVGEGVVDQSELTYVDAWIEDVRQTGVGTGRVGEP
jgi:hypothetical protein